MLLAADTKTIRREVWGVPDDHDTCSVEWAFTG
jgi:hypothetical protein